MKIKNTYLYICPIRSHYQEGLFWNIYLFQANLILILKELNHDKRLKMVLIINMLQICHWVCQLSRLNQFLPLACEFNWAILVGRMPYNGPAIKGVSVPAVGGVARFLPSSCKFFEFYERLPWPSLRASWCRGTMFIESRSPVPLYWVFLIAGNGLQKPWQVL